MNAPSAPLPPSLSPRAPAFDAVRAASLLDACAQSYALGRPDDAISLSAPATDTRALIFLRNSDPARPEAVIAFRGTADLRNWITDLDCSFTPHAIQDRPCKIHTGFLQAWRSIKPTLLETLSSLRLQLPSQSQSRLTLHFTGHSLGGALAMLAAADLAQTGAIPHATCALAFTIASVVTFGQPRVGNAAFRDAYNATLRSRTFRVVHADDIVPRVPWLLGSYRHAGQEVFYPNFPSAPFVNPPWWIKLPSDAVGLARALARGRAALLEDHYLRAYINLLSRAPAGDAPVGKFNLHP